MTKPSKGYRRRTRKKLSKREALGGFIPLSRLLIDYKEGDKVVIDIMPNIHKGMPHYRYQGRIGIIVGRRGRAYLVKTTLGKEERTLIVLPEHLKPFKG